MQSLTLPFSKSGGRGYLAAGPEYITTFQKLPSVPASVRYIFRFPTRSCRTSETQECVYFQSGAIYKGFLCESIRAQPSRVWDGCWAYRPPGGRKDTPARAGGSASPRPAPACCPPAPESPSHAIPVGLGVPLRSHLATRTPRRKREGSPRPRPPPGAQAPAPGTRRPRPPGPVPTLRSAHRPAGPRDVHQPIVARPPDHRDDGGPGLERPARPLAIPTPVPLQRSQLGAAAIFLEERARGEGARPCGLSALLPPPALPRTPLFSSAVT